MSQTTSGVLSSRLAKRWLVRMIPMTIVVLAFSAWGLYDAVVVYPKRGARAAEFLEFQYLRAVEQSRGVIDDRAGIDDPRARMDQIVSRGGAADEIERAMRTWLEQLKLIGQLDGANTRIPRTDFRTGDDGKPIEVTDARSRYERLKAQFTAADGTQAKAPSPLEVWDIPSQWAIMGVCLPIGLLMGFNILKARGKRYTFDPSTLTLTLPAGEQITPADLADVDKRKWHKFIVYLKIKDAHPRLGGREISVDLWVYDPVESWILEMEKAAFPERAQAEEKPATGTGTPPGGGSGGGAESPVVHSKKASVDADGQGSAGGKGGSGNVDGGGDGDGGGGGGGGD